MNRTIHYIWVGGKRKPLIVKRCIDGWKKRMPEWEIIEWNENNIDLNFCDFCKEAYKRKKYAFVADVLRFYILSEYGGLYLDTDVKVLKNLEPLLQKCDALVGYEFEMVNPGLVLYANDPHNQIVDKILERYKSSHFINEDGSENLKVVGEYMSEVLEDYGFVYKDIYQKCGSFDVFPSTFFCPTDAFGNIVNFSDNTYTQHMFAGSWMDWKTRMKNGVKRMMYKLIGKNKIQALMRLYKK